MNEWARRHRARKKWLRRHAATEPIPRELQGEGLTWRGAAAERAKESRAAKRRWRRRVSRARWSQNERRDVILFNPIPFGEGAAIAIEDGDPSGYPQIIRAPWVRGARGIGIAEVPS